MQQQIILIDNDIVSQLQSDISAIKGILADRRPIKAIGGIELAEEVTELSRKTIYNMVSQKRIPFRKQGGKLYFKRSELISWIEGGKEVSLEKL